MRPVRLLPVVIMAGTALLALKGVGLVTNGGYVLSGSSMAMAAGDAAPAAPAATTIGSPTISDGAPTLADAAPTLPLAPDGGDEHGTASAQAGSAAAADDCLPEGEVAATDPEGFNFSPPPDDCVVFGTTAEGDALPTVMTGAGEIVPLATEGSSADALAERLGERRESIEAREAELEMRMALVEAAEQRIEERMTALKSLETRIEALVEEKKTLEESQFVALVAMYETMKPRDAAAIFDQLEMPVMLRVARAMSPRKMAPIMASMDPARAKDLTANLAVDLSEPTIDFNPENVASLPQIVGQ